MKLVSVIMGTFNGRRRIDTAIESILDQTYPSIELLICDDASTDGTFEYLTEKYGKDNRIRLVRLGVNSGLSAALNRCIDVARGEYIARMDDDDVSHPDRIARQIECLERHPEIQFVSTNINYFDDDGVFGCTAGEDVVRSKVDVYVGRTFIHPTVVIRRDAIEAVGRYTVSKLTRRGQDYDLWCKLYHAEYRGLVMGDILYDYYESRSSIKNRKMKYRIDHIRVKLGWRRKLGLPMRYDMAVIHDIVAIMIPSFIYRRLRRRRFARLQSV